jgi:hypothetical protein
MAAPRARAVPGQPCDAAWKESGWPVVAPTVAGKSRCPLHIPPVAGPTRRPLSQLAHVRLAELERAASIPLVLVLDEHLEGQRRSVRRIAELQVVRREDELYAVVASPFLLGLDPQRAMAIAEREPVVVELLAPTRPLEGKAIVDAVFANARQQREPRRAELIDRRREHVVELDAPLYEFTTCERLVVNVWSRRAGRLRSGRPCST